jgi:hypothetical protein
MHEKKIGALRIRTMRAKMNVSPDQLPESRLRMSKIAEKATKLRNCERDGHG